MIIAGGSEATVCKIGIAGFAAMKALSLKQTMADMAVDKQNQVSPNTIVVSHRIIQAPDMTPQQIQALDTLVAGADLQKVQECRKLVNQILDNQLYVVPVSVVPEPVVQAYKDIFLLLQCSRLETLLEEFFGLCVIEFCPVKRALVTLLMIGFEIA